MHLADELPDLDIATYTLDQYKQARQRILDKTIAYGILVCADHGRYGKLIEVIENAFLKGNNNYPTNPTEAYNLLVNYTTYNNKRPQAPGRLDQVAFITDGKRLKTGNEYPQIKCFKCRKMGHYKSDCPEIKTLGGETSQIIQAIMLMTQARGIAGKDEINPMWILCDNESTMDEVKNKGMETNIRNTDKPIEITGIGGEPIKINQVGDLMGYGTVYYHPDVAGNILSFYKLTKRFKLVVYDNKRKDAFVVERDDSSHMEFTPSKEGLYHYDFNLSIKRRLEKEKENQPNEKAMVI